MEADFWHRRWRKNEIGFHESDGSHLLKKHFEAWKLPPDARVFVPLCGKTRDIAWLLSRGLKIVAVELNETAVQALFQELDIQANIDKSGALIKYSAEDLIVYVGDFFSLSASDIGVIDGVYDRAALVALPAQLREQYSQHLRLISAGQSIFLVTYDYDQTLFDGPPFSVSYSIVKQLCEDYYRIKQVYRDKFVGEFRGQKEVYECVYLLR